MKNIILYTSKHGTTEKIVDYIATSLSATVCNVAKEKCPNLMVYDGIIIGGPIYLGSIHSRLQDVIEGNHSLLLDKKLGLFLVCMMSEDHAAEQFNNNFDNDLLSHSLADGFFGGNINDQDLTRMEKFITHIAFRDKNLHDYVLYSEVDHYISALEPYFLP